VRSAGWQVINDALLLITSLIREFGTLAVQFEILQRISSKQPSHKIILS
jgi:hypothetical protein